GKRNGDLHMLHFQAREIGENFFGGISISEAGEYSTQSHSRALKDRLPSTYSGIANDACPVGPPISRSATHLAVLNPNASSYCFMQFPKPCAYYNSHASQRQLSMI